MTGISVITVTYNSSYILDDYLRFLIDGMELGDEVILVDCDSADFLKTAAIAKQYGISVIPAGANVGFGSGTNIGSRHSSAEWLAIVNPDVEVSFNELHALVEIAAENGVTCLGPTVLDQEGTRVTSVHRSMQPPWRRVASDVHSVAGLTFGGSISGCCTVIARSDFESLHGFDEHFFMFAEEIDLHRRVLEQGGSVAATEEVVVRTPGGASSSTTTARWSTTERDVAHVRYVWKHYTPLEAAIDFLWRTLRVSTKASYRPHIVSLKQLWSGVFRTK